jgi:uncharacterized repeat protein (TIGR01451 family)
VVVFRIPRWSKYFVPSGQSGIPADLAPSVFGWRVNGGGIEDIPGEDEVLGTFDGSEPDIDILKETSDDSLCEPEVATFTITVTNSGNAPLSDVTLTDVLPAGLAYANNYVDDPSKPIGQPSGGGNTPPADGYKGTIAWPLFAMQPGEVRVVKFDVRADDCQGTQTNTARVEGLFDSRCLPGPIGVGPAEWSVDIVCECGGTACPRTIGFWRQQCEQRGNGSEKLDQCQMEVLWQCVLEETDVVQWKLNNGDYVLTSSLASKTPYELFTFFCTELQGPRPMTNRDMAEIQYLGLMLNVCSPALPTNIRIDNMFEGTVAAAIDSIEKALNTGVNLGYWKDVADDINNGIGLLAQYCEDANAVFDEVICLDDSAPDQGVLQLSWANSEILAARAYPNPLSGASGAMISFNVPSRYADSPVELAVFDIAGRMVRSLVDGAQGPGLHTVSWDLSDASGQRVSRGVYFYRLRVGGEDYTAKLLVMRD